MKISSSKPLVSLASIISADSVYILCVRHFSNHVSLLNYHNHPMRKIPFPHSRDVENEAQRGEVTCPGHPADNCIRFQNQALCLRTLDYAVM